MGYTTLKQIASITMGQSPKSEFVTNQQTGLPLLNGPTEFGDYHPYPKQFSSKYSKMAKSGDLLFCVRGSVGKMNWANQEYAIGRGIAAIASKNGADFNFFIKALIEIKLPSLLSIATGSTFPNISRGMLEELSFPVVHETEVKIISSLLSNIERYVFNLNLQNQVLEKMAQAIFKHWFVDFEFPNEQGKPYKSSGGKMVASELGEIPEGWLVVSLLEKSDLLSGGTPKTTNDNYWGGNIPWVSAKDIGRNQSYTFVTKTEKTITELGLRHSAANLLPKYTTVLVARGSVGKFAVLGTEMCINQSCYGLFPKKKEDYVLTYFTFKNALDRMQKMVHGTVFDTVTTNTLRDTLVLSAPDRIRVLLRKTVNPLFEKILINQEQIQTLTKMRDLLLPKLISGEIKIKAS